MIPLVVIVGPTGVGKSELAIEVAREVNGEIVSADSRYVYKFMDVGTGKPSLEERRLVPHHMIDLIEPDEEYNAAKFGREAEEKIMEIYERERLPLLVGGSGLYVRAVVNGIFTGPGADWEIRDRLREEARCSGINHLYKKLKEVDPVSAERIKSTDLLRIIRALEIYEITGKPISSFHKERKRLKYDLVMVGLRRERGELYGRIDGRVDSMFERGLVDEVKGLLNRGYGEELNSMQGLGYKEIIEHLKGKYSLEEARRILKRDTRRFAKRQLTWFGKDERIHWIDIGRNEEIGRTVKKIKIFLANLGAMV